MCLFCQCPQKWSIIKVPVLSYVYKLCQRELLFSYAGMPPLFLHLLPIVMDCLSVSQYLCQCPPTAFILNDCSMLMDIKAWFLWCAILQLQNKWGFFLICWAACQTITEIVRRQYIDSNKLRRLTSTASQSKKEKEKKKELLQTKHKLNPYFSYSVNTQCGPSQYWSDPRKILIKEFLPHIYL